MARNTKHTRSTPKIGRVVVIVAVLLVASGLGWAGQGRCVSAEIPGTFILPNGSVHEGGWLKICLERKHSPVAAHHRVYVDGSAVHMIQSRIDGADPESVEEPFFVFQRTALNQLELIGYARRDSGDSQTHILADVTTSEVLNARNERKETKEKEFVLVAAR